MDYKLKVLDRVMCPKLGLEEFEIVSVNTQNHEFTLRSVETNKRYEIYQTHCHAKLRLMTRNLKNRRKRFVELARKISSNPPRKTERTSFDGQAQELQAAL